MNYMEIKPITIENGPGCRVSLFVSGCRNHCKGCFQPESWDFKAGEPFTKETEEHIIDLMSPSYIDGITILGGDPFEPENIDELTKLCRYITVTYPDKTIWVYTGYKFEDFADHEIMRHIDVLVDGRFVEEQKDLSLRFCGSRNQRLIDVPKSLESGKVVLWNDWEDKESMRKTGYIK